MNRIAIISRRTRLTQRGSILLLVLALLAVLVLFATTLLYISKIEGAASNNAGKMVQNRMSLLTGVPMAINALARQSGKPLAMNQAWTALDFSSVNAAQNLLSASPTESPTPASAATPAASASIVVEAAKDDASQKISAAAATLAQSAISDQSALLNLNAIAFPTNPSAQSDDSRLVSAGTFRQFVDARLKAAGLPPDKNSKLADAILNSRLGQDKAPGTSDRKATSASANLSDVSASQFVMDIRSKPNGDDAPYRTIEDLLKVPGMSMQTCQAIAPYITTFSSSLDVWTDEEGNRYPRLPVNTASLTDIVTLLQNLYPSMNLEEIQQFAVNIADRRDTDTIPTVFAGGVGVDPIIGCEFNPIVSEVCPDVITLAEDGDNGEYIELYNPLATAVSLQGWRVDWGAGMTMLSGVLVPQGYLIITDNIKKDDDPNPLDDAPGMGSFVDVFGVYPTGGQKCIMEVPGMDIPDPNGRISLYDRSGNLIDYLTYRNSVFNGANRGFQKRYLFGHVGFPGTADPFKNDLVAPADDNTMACFQLYGERMNQFFKSEVELLAVPCGYSPGLEDAESGWEFPSLASNRSDKLDGRLIDCFTAADKATSPLIVNGMLQKIDPAVTPAPSPGLASAASAPEILLARKSEVQPIAFGKINVNSAPQEVLQVLPGLTEKTASRIVDLRRAAMASTDSTAKNKAMFDSLSDFASSSKVWSDVKPYDRLVALSQLMPVLTVNSTSYRIISTEVDPTITDPARVNRQSCQALVCLSGNGASIIDWNFVFLPAQTDAQLKKATADESATTESAASQVSRPSLIMSKNAAVIKSVK